MSARHRASQLTGTKDSASRWLRRDAGREIACTTSTKRHRCATKCFERAGFPESRAELDDIQGVGHGKLAPAGIELTDSGYSSLPPPQHTSRATNRAAALALQEVTPAARFGGGGSGATLVVPMGLLSEEQALARRMVAGLEPGQAQAVLDELSGRMASATPPRNPLSYLRGLADRAQADSFLPELAPRVAQQREPRGEVAGLQGLGSRMVGSGLPSGEAVEAPGSAQGSGARRLSNAGDIRQSGSTPPAASDTASHADPAVPDGSDGSAAQVSALQLRRAESMRQLRNLSLRLQALHGNLPLRGTRKERA